MFKYICKRILMAIPVLLGIVTIVFIVMRAFAPNPAAMMLGQEATGEKIAQLEQHLGLDQPIIVQYGKFLGQTLQGDFGDSLLTKQPVFKEILERFPATIELTLAAILISTILGITIGVIAAVKQYSLFDYASMFGGLIGVSLPSFWLGLMLIVIFAVNLGWFPVSGRLPMEVSLEKVTGFYILDSILTGNGEALWMSLKHITLPAISIGISSIASIARITRSTMLETIRQDYIRTARAKGLKENIVVIKHALKNALIPIVTVIGLQLGGLMGGAVLTETIFSWPGVGSYIVNGINNSDYAVVQAGAVLVATIFVTLNIIVDVIYAYLDPKIRYS